MAYKQKTEMNEEQVISFLTEIVEKIKTEEDPLELNVYRRLFRKCVPFTLRSYFASYLLKQHFAGNLAGKNSLSSRNDRSGKANSKARNEKGVSRQEEQKQNKQPDTRRTEGRGNSAKITDAQQAPTRGNANRLNDQKGSEQRVTDSRVAEPRVSEPRIVLADDVSTTLFISIGRNRRVYPRDLIGLIMQNVEIERDHVGEIRVLDNYSFVQVITEDAEKIIASLNDFEYRGRKLAVSYSRKRDDQASVDNTASEDSAESDTWLSETDGSDNEENDTDI